MHHHNNRALAKALGPDVPPSRRAARPSNHSGRGLLALTLALTMIGGLAPAVALARPALDTVTTAKTLPRASRAPQQAAPATVEIVRPERTIVRDVDAELPVIIGGAALLIALAGAAHAHARIHALTRRVSAMTIWAHGDGAARTAHRAGDAGRADAPRGARPARSPQRRS